MMHAHFSWRPYLAGGLLGILATLSVWFTAQGTDSAKYLGASTTFVRAAGLLEKTVVPEHVAANEYFQAKGVKVDWQFMLVLGILLGAFASAWVGREIKYETIPPIWRERFGSRLGVRAAGAFFGGAVAMFGARLAGGCPSGHGLSGLMQLSISGYLAMAGFFAGGVLIAHLTYRKESKHDN